MSDVSPAILDLNEQDICVYWTEEKVIRVRISIEGQEDVELVGGLERMGQIQDGINRLCERWKDARLPADLYR